MLKAGESDSKRVGKKSKLKQVRKYRFKYLTCRVHLYSCQVFIISSLSLSLSLSQSSSSLSAADSELESAPSWDVLKDSYIKSSSSMMDWNDEEEVGDRNSNSEEDDFSSNSAEEDT